MLLQGKMLSTRKDINNNKKDTDILLVFIYNKSQNSSLNSNTRNPPLLLCADRISTALPYSNGISEHGYQALKKIMVAKITQKQPKVLSACKLECQSPTGHSPPQLLQLVFFTTSTPT